MRVWAPICVAGLVFASLRAPAASAADAVLPEPNFEIASQWWPEMENVWTPIGWKDHPLRFNVLYNGTLIAEPVRRPSLGQGVQLTFIPSTDDKLPASRPTTQPYALAKEDGGVGEQGWKDGAAPVLWSRWHRDGVTFQTEVFAHIPGGGPVRTGMEPLFAWVRLSVQDAQANAAGDHRGWFIRLNNPHISHDMWRDRNLIAHPAQAAYPGQLTPHSNEQNFLLFDSSKKVRLAAVKAGEAVQFIDRPASGTDAFLRVDLSEKSLTHVDLLVPLLPVDEATSGEELKLGFDGALREAEQYWARVPDTSPEVVTPERLVNEAFRQAPKLAEVVAERNLDIGLYSLISGAWHYERLWATPTSMNFTMILDLIGHHATTEKYLEIFKNQQGTVVPPGKAYKLHPGYFSSPKALTAIDWLTDHGAILYSISHHALLTGDPQFIDHWIEPILKGCEFIRDSRRIRGHGGVEGILPPAVPTDSGIQVQSVWTDGWNYKALATTVRLLQRIGHPRAAEFAEEAREYKQAFVRAMRDAAQHTPQWSDAQGQKHHLVPTALPDGGDMVHPFYLDTGPLFLVYGELMNADDDLMRSAARYFREGPNTKVYNLKGNWDQPISLRHEMSSCEPGYSWNVYHSHQLGDRDRYLEGMYSLLAGAMSRHTSIGCEHRGGVGGALFSVCLPLDLARLAVIDDQVRFGELHLLRLTPLAWLKEDFETRFERIPTEFGPVTLRFQLQQSGKQLKVSFTPPSRIRPEKILLHVPPIKTLQEVNLNGKLYKASAGSVLTVE